LHVDLSLAPYLLYLPHIPGADNLAPEEISLVNLTDSSNPDQGEQILAAEAILYYSRLQVYIFGKNALYNYIQD
jgi:hypothetical protein